jgi:hypothetical protein
MLDNGLFDSGAGCEGVELPPLDDEESPLGEDDELLLLDDEESPLLEDDELLPDEELLSLLPPPRPGISLLSSDCPWLTIEAGEGGGVGAGDEGEAGCVVSDDGLLPDGEDDPLFDEESDGLLDDEDGPLICSVEGVDPEAFPLFGVVVGLTTPLPPFVLLCA